MIYFKESNLKCLLTKLYPFSAPCLLIIYPTYCPLRDPFAEGFPPFCRVRQEGGGRTFLLHSSFVP